MQEYPAAFEEFWGLCRNAGRGKGNKYPAFKAWVKRKPDPKVAAETWNLWMQTPAWVGGFNPNVSSWLNDRGYERQPTEVEMRPRNGTNERDVKRGWAEPAPAAAHTGGKVQW